MSRCYPQPHTPQKLTVDGAVTEVTSSYIGFSNEIAGAPRCCCCFLKKISLSTRPGVRVVSDMEDAGGRTTTLEMRGTSVMKHRSTLHPHAMKSLLVYTSTSVTYTAATIAINTSVITTTTAIRITFESDSESAAPLRSLPGGVDAVSKSPEVGVPGVNGVRVHVGLVELNDVDTVEDESEYPVACWGVELTIEPSSLIDVVD